MEYQIYPHSHRLYRFSFPERRGEKPNRVSLAIDKIAPMEIGKCRIDPRPALLYFRVLCRLSLSLAVCSLYNGSPLQGPLAWPLQERYNRHRGSHRRHGNRNAGCRSAFSIWSTHSNTYRFRSPTHRLRDLRFRMPYLFRKASLLHFPSRPLFVVVVADPDAANIALSSALADVNRGQQGKEGIRLEIFAVL